MERPTPNKLTAVASAMFLAGAALNGYVALDAHDDATRATAQAEEHEQFKGNSSQAQDLRIEADHANDRRDMHILIASLNLAASGASAMSAVSGSTTRRRYNQLNSHLPNTKR